MRVAVYDTATGDILRIVECPDSAAPGQAGAGEDVAEVEASVADTTHRIEDGLPVPL